MPVPRRVPFLRSATVEPAGPLVFSETSSATGLTLALAGELDLHSAPRFNARLDEIVRHGEGELVADLRALQFVDSAGLLALLNAQRRLTRQGRRLCVLCSDGPVLRAIQLARLTETFNLSLDG